MAERSEILGDRFASLIPFAPLSSKIVVRVVDLKYKGLLIIPATAKKPAPMRAEVMAMGPGMLCKDGTRWPMPDCKPGDFILMRPNSGQEFQIGGTTYLKIHDDDVLAVIEEE
jgi:co-chaperonin GroES (HSP10)